MQRRSSQLFSFLSIHVSLFSSKILESAGMVARMVVMIAIPNSALGVQSNCTHFVSVMVTIAEFGLGWVQVGWGVCEHKSELYFCNRNIATTKGTTNNTNTHNMTQI